MHGVTIKEVGNNLFLAIFISEEDMVEVLDKSSWTFDRRLILLKQFKGDLSLGNVSFQYSPFWIRVFNIPIKSMNSFVGTRIANEIGVSILVDAPKSGLAWGPFLRIWVDIDITKPLMRGIIIQIEGAEKCWVFFKYERLPTFCYRCGILGHQDRECCKVHRGSLSIDEDELQFGPWMRAIAPKIKQRKGSPSQSRFSDDDEEENQVTNREKDGTRQPNIHHQPPSIPMTGEVDMDIAKQQPKNSRQLTDLSKLKFPEPIQISIFEWDSGVSESVSSKDPDFSSFSKLKSPRNP